MRIIILLALASVVLSTQVIHEVDLGSQEFLRSNGIYTVRMI